MHPQAPQLSFPSAPADMKLTRYRDSGDEVQRDMRDGMRPDLDTECARIDTVDSNYSLRLK